MLINELHEKFRISEIALSTYHLDAPLSALRFTHLKVFNCHTAFRPRSDKGALQLF